MSATPVNDRDLEVVFEKAAGWYLRHRVGSLSPAEKEEFLEWLRSSKLHVQEYLELVNLRYGLVRTLPTLRLHRAELLERAQEELGGNVQHLGSRATALDGVFARRQFEIRRPLAAVAAGLCLIATTAWVVSTVSNSREISVPRGEQRTVQLPDGSTMHVNADSKARIRFSTQERLIELSDGQALFEVARQPSRPFRVRAGETDIIAIGTQFDVYRRGSSDVRVTVIQGAVEVANATGHQPRVRLIAGEQVEVTRAGTLPAVRGIDIRVATAWMRREVIFKGEPLSQVVEELNRYIAVPVNIEDPELSKMRVRAVFNAYDSESFLAFLQQYDVEVQTTAEAIHVRRRASASERGP